MAVLRLLRRALGFAWTHDWAVDEQGLEVEAMAWKAKSFATPEAALAAMNNALRCTRCGKTAVVPMCMREAYVRVYRLRGCPGRAS